MTTGFGGLYTGVDAINQYGCVKCQARHYEDEPIYQEHISFQSKHGITHDRDWRLAVKP